jgi:hypothetical protein
MKIVIEENVDGKSFDVHWFGLSNVPTVQELCKVRDIFDLAMQKLATKSINNIQNGKPNTGSS